MMNNNNEVFITDAPVSGLLISNTQLSCFINPSIKNMEIVKRLREKYQPTKIVNEKFSSKKELIY